TRDRVRDSAVAGPGARRREAGRGRGPAARPDRAGRRDVRAPRRVGPAPARLSDRQEGRGRLPPRVLKIDDGVMRHMATRRPEGGPSEPMAPAAAIGNHVETDPADALEEEE